MSDMKKVAGILDNNQLTRVVAHVCEQFCDVLDEYVDELDLGDVETTDLAWLAMDRIANKIDRVKKRLDVGRVPTHE